MRLLPDIVNVLLFPTFFAYTLLKYVPPPNLSTARFSSGGGVQRLRKTDFDNNIMQFHFFSCANKNIHKLFKIELGVEIVPKLGF